MLDIKKLTREILQNKINNNFPTNDLYHEFELLCKEVVEAKEVLDQPEKLGKELADIVIFAMSVARIVDINLEQEIEDKVEYNKTRTYKAGTYRITPQ